MGGIITCSILIILFFGIRRLVKKNVVTHLIANLFLVVVLGFSAYVFADFAFDEVEYWIYDKDEASRMDWCESLYVDRDYSGLMVQVSLYHLEGERFQKYCEIVAAYQTFQTLQVWQRAETEGVEGAAKMVEKYQVLHKRNIANSGYEENKRLMERW